MPRGLNRSGDFRNGTPITLPHEFGNPVDLTTKDFGNKVTWSPDPAHFGNPVTWPTPDPAHFGNPINVSGQQVTPTFSPVAGSYGSTQSVTIISAGADTIYYTTDGSTPTVLSSVYSSPVSVAVSLTLKALAVKSGLTNSNIGSAAYVISTTSGFELEDSSGVILLEDGSILLLEVQ